MSTAIWHLRLGMLLLLHVIEIKNAFAGISLTIILLIHLLIFLRYETFSDLPWLDRMHENTDWKRQSALLFWYNEPCVVIGSHQNPWIECNLEMMQRDNVKLARRRSGGGAVFHVIGFFGGFFCHYHSPLLVPLS